MHLKSLTALGFKSFADKTTLNFQPGITAIVGPNGCGKSNVADAIRWVLGEQSAKALRGSEMADVIFNGTDSRKPLSMSEVSLTLGGVDQEHLKAAGVPLDFNEVTLTRRVFRDGASEYFINKAACRLRDIQQLFMGTGVGRASYSIMAQGHITQILSSKPDERRLVFEEAAGITKYKAQKKESLRKLEYTDQNLVRVADLIREVKRQIGSLQRQAGKARRHKQLMADLRHLESQLARHQYDVILFETAERDEALRAVKVENESTLIQIERGEEELARQRTVLSALDGEIHQKTREALELKSEMERNDSRMHFIEQRLRELEMQHEAANHDIVQAEESCRAAAEGLVLLNERVTQSSAVLQSQREQMRARQETLSSVESRLRAAQEEARRAQAEAFSIAHQVSRCRNEINALDLHRQGNVTRLEKLLSEQAQTTEETNRLEEKLREFARQVEVEKLEVTSRRSVVEERSRRLRELQQAFQQVSQEMDLTLRQQAEKRSRLAVLEQLELSHEGFSAAAQAVLKQTRDVLGSLADKIRVPDAYVAPIEAALGQGLQLALTGSSNSARTILGELANRKQGRASIASLELCALIQETCADPLPQGAPEGFIPALSVVHADPSVRALIEQLLGRTLIAPDLEAATTTWQATGGQFDFVTQGGDLLSRHGVYTGGAANGGGSGKGPSSILGRKNQIEELRVSVTLLQDQINEQSRKKADCQREQSELQSSLQHAQAELRTHEVAVAAREGEYRALQQTLKALLQKSETIQFEMESLRGQESASGQKRETLIAALAESESREKQSLALGTEAHSRIEELRHERDMGTAALTEVKVALATEEQLFASNKSQIAPLEQRIRELAQRIERRRNETASFFGRKSQAESEILEARQRNEFLALERDRTSERIAVFAQEKAGQEEALTAREEEVRQFRANHTSLLHRKGTLEVELAQRAMSAQNLCERLFEKHQLNLTDIRSECITITIADSGPARVEVLTPEDMAARGVGTDWNMVAEEVAGLQRRIEEIGPVNLVAIEEYEETEQRHQFLSTQHDDLVKAKDQLMEIINRINAETKDLFAETFAKIRENFRAMFAEIFGGGQADLKLVDEGDALESGIEIVARPPGKQMRNIALLSGGEQTMTAVALLFSIYQVKPSPFCVLDELDAPLDESNINRFLKILQRFLPLSQFVIITHNKRTIGIADVLYGVTMQEQGISRIVSVKFHKTDEPTSGRNIQPLVPPVGISELGTSPPSSKTQDESMEIVMAK